MEPLEKKAMDFLLELSRVINFMQMYNETHPTVRQTIQQAYKTMNEVLRMQPTLAFGKGEGVLLIQNKQMTDKHPAADRFVKMLGERNISGVMLKQGVPESELVAFVKLMATKPDHVVVDGQIKPELLKPFNKISINEIKYLMVGEGEDLESLTEARKFFNSVFSEEFKGLKGTDALQHIGKTIQKLLPQLTNMNLDNKEGELWEFFEKSIQSFGGGGIRQTRQSLLTTVKTMAPDVQKSLFGQVIKSPQQLEAVLKKFSKERKAEMLVEEVTEGSKMTAALESLLKSNGEIVELAEALTRKFGGSTDEGKLDNIFKILQQIESGQRIVMRKRGKVMIAEPDEKYRQEYNEVLSKMNFEVEMINNGRDMLNHVKVPQNRPDVIVMDVKLPGLSGLEILNTLDMEKIRIPVMLCTEMATIQNAFEVQMYPKLKFLNKPFNYKDFMDGIDALCPKVEEIETKVDKEEKVAKGEMSAELKAELNKAREIQRNLMPAKFPEMPGYEVHAFYKACDEVGGDYYDVFQLDPDHIGILVADVSGHGISGAMVMVMVRSAIRTWAASTTSPKELFQKVNPLVARDILPGMFVTMYYAVLDTNTKTLTCSCAGHNPAALWRAKTKKAEFTKKGGMPLGIIAGAAFGATLKEEVFQLEKGDRLIVYTDAMVETMSPDYEEFGEERFMKAVTKLAFQPSNVFIQQLVHAVVSFQSTAPQHDDITVVTLRSLQ